MCDTERMYTKGGKRLPPLMSSARRRFHRFAVRYGKLDSVCMLFIAIGEALKNIGKITGGTLFSQYPEIDWKGAMGFRNIIAHQYFDIDAEEVFWICTHEVSLLSTTIKK